MKKGFILSILTAVALLVTACGGASGSTSSVSPPTLAAASAALDTQTSDAGNVVVDVTPISLGGARWDFKVSFNTHSVNLAFDPAQISLLRCDQGQEFQPVAWDGSGPGGHHRSGVLSFARPDHRVSSVELVMRGVAQVPERIFHWDVPVSAAPAGSDQASRGEVSQDAAAQIVTGAEAGPPHVALSGEVFDYGDVPMEGGVVTRQMQITNTGVGVLHISGVEPT
jgi:hypothetical protein